VETASVKILYNGKNISADISEHLLSLTYTDKTHGESDELEIELEDASKLWQFDWYPEKGAKITASIYDGHGKILECGTFQLDEIEQRGGIDGDFITFKCIAAGITQKVRTKNNSVHNQKTLREIANTIAARHGLTIAGNIENVTIGYMAQVKETDLHFLKRIAFEYGHVFSLRDNKIIFTNLFELESRGGVATISREDIVSYSITDKTADTYKSTRLKYHDPAQRKLVEWQQQEQNEAYSDVKGDSLELTGRAENVGQAQLKSKAALHNKNSRQQSGNISMPGHVLMMAGNNIELAGLGKLSGLYHIESSTHVVTRSGAYTTEGEIKRVGKISTSKQKPL